jgi:sugar phosphate isomerase/epimerase
MNRRVFLKAAAASGVATMRGRAALQAEPLSRIGVQLFTIPKLLEEDFAGALALLAGIGYQEVELFGPFPFSDPTAQERWKSVAAAMGLRGSGFFGRSPRELRAILDRNGLSAPAAHVDLQTLRTRLGEAADAAHVLGMKYVGISSIPADQRRTLDGYKRMADEFNEIGAKADTLGLRFIYHNHGYGLGELEGQVPLRVVLDRTDPARVAMEMDLFWTVAGGADPVDLLDTYRGRYRLIHIKDMKQRVRFKGDGGDPSQWMELFPYMTDAGSGVLDLRTILSHAKKSGVEHFLLEQDLAANPAESLRKSFRFLGGLDL